MKYETVDLDSVIERILPETIKQGLNPEKTLHICGRRNSDTITFVTFELAPEKRRAQLKYIYVTPAYRRMHYGLELLEESRLALASKGIRYILVEINGDMEMIRSSDIFLSEAEFNIEDAADGIRLWSSEVR